MTISSVKLQETLDNLWTITDVAKYFGKCEMTIRLWRENKELPAITIKGDQRPALRFIPNEVREWARKNKIKIDNEPASKKKARR